MMYTTFDRCTYHNNKWAFNKLNLPLLYKCYKGFAEFCKRAKVKNPKTSAYWVIMGLTEKDITQENLYFYFEQRGDDPEWLYANLYKLIPAQHRIESDKYLAPKIHI